MTGADGTPAVAARAERALRGRVLVSSRASGSPGADLLVDELRGAGWEVVASRRTTTGTAGPVDLVAVAAGDPADPSVVRSAAIEARRWAAPLVVVGGDLPGDRLSRILLDRLVTVHVAAGTAPVLTSPLLAAVGVGGGASPAEGIGPLGLRDLPAVVDVHRSAFPEAATTALGPRVVERYYRWQFTGPHPLPFAVGAWRRGRLDGFLFGGVRRDAVSGFARRYALAVALGAVRHPLGTRQLVGAPTAHVAGLALRHRDRRSPGSAPTVGGRGRDASDAGVDPATSFGVLSLAVRPDAQGSGAATALVEAAADSAASAGLGAMHLTVDVANPRAVRFYEREGWTRDPPEGAWTGRMVRSLGR